MNLTSRLATTTALAAAFLTVAGCATTTVHKTAATPAASSATQAPATDTPAPSDSTTDPAGGIGDTFTVTSSDGTSYDVTLIKVDQHATLGAYETLDNSADHAAAAEFKITGDTGQSSDDANNDANAIGSDQTEYQPSFVTLTVPNFNAGDFKVAPGQTEKGWVAFELPPGTTIAQVQWAPGLDGQAATWTVQAP